MILRGGIEMRDMISHWISAGAAYYLSRPHMTAVHPLASLRAELHWSQDKLSARSDVSVRTIGHIERRAWLPRNGTRRKLLLALGRDFSEHREVFEAGDDEEESQK